MPIGSDRPFLGKTVISALGLPIDAETLYALDDSGFLIVCLLQEKDVVTDLFGSFRRTLFNGIGMDKGWCCKG